jgi:hypothetical protein
MLMSSTCWIGLLPGAWANAAEAASNTASSGTLTPSLRVEFMDVLLGD